MRSTTPQMKLTVIVAALICTGTIGTDRASAQDGYEPQTPVGKMAQSLNPQNWQMPKFKMPKFKMPEMKTPMLKRILPGADEKDRIVKRKNSLVSEVKQTAHRSWTKTKEMLNPMRLIPASFLAPADESVKPAEKSSAMNGFFGNVLNRPEPAKKNDDATVTDFLRQTKPIR